METNSKPLLANKRTCTGCLACVDTCKQGALTTEIRTDGHYYPKFNPTKCINCGLCTKSCPVISNFRYKSEPFETMPYAAWANNDNIRMQSASGGVFAAIATYFITNGGYVAGAVMDGLYAKHILTNKLEDIKHLQGSKYLQSDTTGIFNNVYNTLRKGNDVLFSGLPCQIAAVYSFIGKRKYKGTLTTIDLICSGVPSRLPIEIFNVKLNNKIKEIKYRDKINGWHKSQLLVVEDLNSEIRRFEINKQNLIYSSFLSGLINRYSCNACKYVAINRKSDITLADFWGLKEYKEEHFKGVSLVFTHSNNGEKLLMSSDITFHETTWGKCIPFNPRMVYGKRPFHRVHPARIFLPFLFKHMSYNNLTKIYSGNISKKDILWLPYKLFNYINYKLGQKLIKKHIKKSLTQLIPKNALH